MTVFAHISGGAYVLHNGLNWLTLNQAQATALAAAIGNPTTITQDQYNTIKPLFQDNTLAQIPLTVQGASNDFIQSVSDQQTTVILQNAQANYGNELTDAHTTRDTLLSAINSH